MGTLQYVHDPIVELAEETMANVNEAFQPKYLTIAKASTSFIQQALTDQVEGRDPSVEEDIKEVATILYAGRKDHIEYSFKLN
ncbi:hypothetical protein M422DRAFT_238856 [Sphaerobolus stellatus SS14]|nr:hypothetical protein M422DRAFT_238856 [Sphaerobolus stellatus SS14]